MKKADSSGATQKKNKAPHCRCGALFIKQPVKKQLHSLLAPRDGLEPPTGWLTATCSTN